MTSVPTQDEHENHPWKDIDLETYELHMQDSQVGQLQLLHHITSEQLADHPGTRVGVLGVAGGNGLDIINSEDVTAVYGIDINPQYLETCRARFQETLGEKLHLLEAKIARDVAIDYVDLLIANVIVEYVGVTEFVAFALANSSRIGILTIVTQRNDGANFVSSTKYAHAFDGLASVSSDVNAEELRELLVDEGFTLIHSVEYPLPNGKTFVRQDFTSRPIAIPIDSGA